MSRRIYSRTPPDARYDAKVDRSAGPDACWPWLGAIASTGYGAFNRGGGQLVAAHRYAYERASGPIPVGAHILHSCDVRACCNPAHLRSGTPADNIADMDARGRRRNPTPRRGIEHHGAKLTPEIVAAARAEWSNRGKTGRSAKGTTLAQLAARYDVSTSTMWAAVTGRTWT